MRICRHCSHHNADHLGYCSRCGRRLGASTFTTPSAGTGGPSGPGRGSGNISGQVGMLAATAAMSATVVAGAPVGAGSASAGGAALAGGAAGNPIGYIYVYIRGKLHAGERRRRLIEERDGAQALLTGSVRDLGARILRDGIQHPELTGLLEAVGRAEAKRAAAAADIITSEKQKEQEETHLASQETAAEVDWMASDQAARDGEEAVRAASSAGEAAAGRLARVRDERARLLREADELAAAATPEGRARAASLRREHEARAAEERGLDEHRRRLEQERAELREKAVSLRAAAAAARANLDQAATVRRQAASAMGASVAGHVRDRADAERAIAEMTEQLGRVTAQLQPARPAATALVPLYQRIDRLQDTIATRTIEIAALERASAHYDQRKLLTGVGLLTSMLLATAAALWAVLK